MTKVGVYAVARMYTLVFGADGGPAANLAQPWLPLLGLGTIALAAVGALAAREMRGLIGYLVIGSAGTLLTALGLGSRETVAAALFYLVNSTLVVAILYLLADRIGAQRGAHGDALAPGPFGGERSLLGAAYFVAAIAVCGLPPLAGFLGKSLLLDAALDTGYAAWVWAVVLVSGMATIISVVRAGSRIFWKPYEPPVPASTIATSSVQAMAMGWLFAALLLNAAAAGPLARFTGAAAQQLLEPRTYVEAVLGARPVPPAIPIRDILGGKPAHDKP
jgi:multicomponent K+:H+ antiporter subunit D